jgi:hypothetical protein
VGQIEFLEGGVAGIFSVSKPPYGKDYGFVGQFWNSFDDFVGLEPWMHHKAFEIQWQVEAIGKGNIFPALVVVHVVVVGLHLCHCSRGRAKLVGVLDGYST